VGERTRSRTTTLSLVTVGFVVSGVFTWLALRNVHLEQVWTSLRESNYWWVIPSVAFLAASQGVRALRWQYLFPAQTRPPYRPVLAATLLGQFFNNVLPARAGEAARVIALNRSSGTAATEVVATVVVERLYDVIALLVMLFVLLPWLPEVTWVHAASILAIALVVLTAAGVVVLVRWGERPARWLLRPVARLPFVSVEQTERAAASIHRGVASLYDPTLALVAMTLTAASWILLALSAWVLMKGFDLGLSPLAGGLVMVSVGLGLILPSSPAAVGVFEAAALIALKAYGIEKSAALSYALVLHAVNFFPYIVAGVVVLHGQALAVRRELTS
jgi:glycosyltransferase 2 family protein